MPVHSIASVLGDIDSPMLIGAAVALLAAVTVKAWTSGRRCTWERDWAGKLIMVVAPPTPTTLALLDTLLHLPSPPQILYLPPHPSPLPSSLVTLIHTLRLGAESNPRAQIHCEPCPPTPAGVRALASRWGKAEYGTAGEGGRRVDAIVLGGAWEVNSGIDSVWLGTEEGEVEGSAKDQVRWSPHEYHFHLVTSLLPTLLRTPAERSIRIVSLLPPTWSAAIPSLKGDAVPKPTRSSPSSPSPSQPSLHQSAARGITSALIIAHLRLVLDTLASATFGSNIVPDPTQPLKQRDERVQSNILALGVIMPWARDEIVAALLGVQRSWYRLALYILLYPIMVIFTPSPNRAIQSVLFALSAPVRYPDGTVSPSDSEPSEKVDRSKQPQNSDAPPSEQPPALATSPTTKGKEKEDPRRAAVGQGDFVRDCAVFDLPPVLYDPVLAREAYEKIEKNVEEGVRRDAAREKAFGNPSSATTSKSS